MKNATSAQRIAELHPLVRPSFEGFINDAEAALNIELLVPQAYRTFPQQQAIYNQGRTTPGPIVTEALAGESYHNYGLAADVAPKGLDGNPLWKYNFAVLVPFAAKYGITWGGHFPDPDVDHFEMKLGYKWHQLLVMYNAGNFLPGTHYLNLKKAS
jgi:LAS superfamily LD-carboxypeptidase LdcB